MLVLSKYVAIQFCHDKSRGTVRLGLEWLCTGSSIGTFRLQVDVFPPHGVEL